MLRHAQIHNVVTQMPQKSDSAIFYKRKRCTTVFLIEFFPRNGGGPGGPTQAQMLTLLVIFESVVFHEEISCETRTLYSMNQVHLIINSSSCIYFLK